MKFNILLILTTFLIHSCSKKEKLNEENLTHKIKVLNIGVFHMGHTSDKIKTKFDPKINKHELINLNQLLSEFKPTIILVETEPKYQDQLYKNYLEYIKNPTKETDFQNEIQFIAFEVGRLANTKKIYGIDNRLGYNYTKIDKLAHQIDAYIYIKGQKSIEKMFDTVGSKKLVERIIAMNKQKYYDALINYNADLLTYVNTRDNFEGADVASDFYLRNLRMFANINRVKVNNNDRIFILSGATHAAFFDMFIKRSPKFELVPLTYYLK